MAGTPTILPSARVFTGPGDRLFGYDRIWVLIYVGTTKTVAEYDPGHLLIRGRRGDDGSDLELLTHTLQQAHKGTVNIFGLSIHRSYSQSLHMQRSMRLYVKGTIPHHSPGTTSRIISRDRHTLP